MHVFVSKFTILMFVFLSICMLFPPQKTAGSTKRSFKNTFSMSFKKSVPLSFIIGWCWKIHQRFGREQNSLKVNQAAVWMTMMSLVWLRYFSHCLCNIFLQCNDWWSLAMLRCNQNDLKDVWIRTILIAVFLQISLHLWEILPNDFFNSLSLFWVFSWHLQPANIY